MAYTFLKAGGTSTGQSKIEEQSLSMAKKFLKQMEVMGKKVHLPVDHLVIEKQGSRKFRVSNGPDISGREIAMDIGPKTCVLFTKALQEAACIFWNGPMGVYEQKPFDKGSVALARAIGKSRAFTVIGGGDSAAVARSSGLSPRTNPVPTEEKTETTHPSEDILQVDHISTGGGAGLEYIQGHKLPGLEVLKVRKIQ